MHKDIAAIGKLGFTPKKVTVKIKGNSKQLKVKGPKSGGK
jgi:hypothetical protein